MFLPRRAAHPHLSQLSSSAPPKTLHSRIPRITVFSSTNLQYTTHSARPQSPCYHPTSRSKLSSTGLTTHSTAAGRPRSKPEPRSSTLKCIPGTPTSPSPSTTTTNIRCFSSGIPRSARYKRFGDAGGGGPGYGGYRESIIMKLLYAARPQHFVLVGLVLGGLYVYNSDTVEMTGRQRFNCIPYEWELNTGRQSYSEVLRANKGKILPENHPLTGRVNGVLQRLIPLAPIDGANWKVHVIRDDGMVNAFVLPGGKVFVYTGILPICGDEDGLAAVLGHEIAHVVAHHPGERMSNSILTIGAVFLISAMFDISGQLPSLALNLVYGLPNSRTQEAEADNIGLMMMSKACFNPEAAARLWGRMQKEEQGTPPQFLSTHPTSYNRMEAIREWLPKAENTYEDSGCSSIRHFVPGFKQVSSSFGW